MNWNRFSATLLLPFCLLASPTLHAALTLYTSEGAFNSLGVTTQNSNFDFFTSDTLKTGPDYAVGDLHFTNPASLLVAPSYLAITVRSVITTYDYSALTVDISGMHNLLAFEAGRVASKEMLDAFYFEGLSHNLIGTLHTNLGDYSLLLSDVPLSSDGLSFFGFATDTEGEYFTGLTLGTEDYFGSSAGLTALQLGKRSATVPDAESALALLAISLASLAALARRRILRS